MSLTDYQFSYNGLTFNAGTNIGLISIAGLADLPDIRSSDVARPRDQGLLFGNDFLGGRTITLALEIVKAPGLTLAQSVDLVKAAFQPLQNTALPLAFQLPGQGNRVINCRCRKLTDTVDVSFAGGITTMSVQLSAMDPRIYDATGQTMNTTLPTAFGGVTFNVTFPLTFPGGTITTGGTITSTNSGNYPTRPVVTITGPVTNPRLENVNTGETLTLMLTLAGSDTLTINFDARVITLNGTASRYGTVASGSVFWQIYPGSNTITFRSSDSAPTGAVAYVAFASAWL